MKAVNLIPVDERRGGSGFPGRSGGAVYAVLGVLGVLLIALGAYAVLSRQVVDRETELADLQTQTAEISAQTEVLRPFGEFAELRTQRVSALRTLAGARIDWSTVLEELSIALPADARLGSMTASVAPAAEATPAAEGAAEPGGPSLQMTGCTTSDRDVADMMVRLRQMSGVRSVDVASAGEDENGEPIAGAPADCTTSFDVTVTFAPLPGAAAAGVAAASAPAPAEEDADDGEATPAAPSADAEEDAGTNADETADDGEATPAAPSGDAEEGEQ